MTDWVALGREPDGWRGFGMEGGQVLREVRAGDDAVVLDQFGAGATVLRLGEGSPDTLPTPVLPKGGAQFSGLMQNSPPDVAGGWTRLWIAGFLAVRPDWVGVVVVSEGDTRHWLHLSAGEVVSMQGVLTPRLQAALGGAVAADPEAIADTMSRPERLAAHLHAAEVSGRSDTLTGHLIGAELAAARMYWLGQQVAVFGPDDAPLAGALQGQGVPVETVEAEALIAPGLAAVGAALGFCG